MYSQFYPTDLDNWKIWEVQTDDKPTEGYVTMDDDLDDMLIEAVQELAVEKPVEDEVVEDEVVEDVVDEELPSVADASMQTETDEEDLQYLKVWANEQGGANLPLLPSAGEYFYLY